MKQQKADHRSQRTYRLVSSAFAELLSEKPYDEILVQDILDRAGIGRTTFYAHYFDKEDVLDSMTEQILSMFTHQIAHSTARQRVVPISCANSQKVSLPADPLNISAAGSRL